VIVLDFDVDNVDGAVQLVPAAQQVCGERAARTFTHAIEAPLLTGDHNVCNSAALVPALRRRLNAPIAVEHGQQSIRFVELRVLAQQVLEHDFVRRPERINVGFIDRRTRKTHRRAGAARHDMEAGVSVVSIAHVLQGKVPRHGPILCQHSARTWLLAHTTQKATCPRSSGSVDAIS